MQANLKPNNQRSQCLLLTLSNLQDSKQEQQNEASKYPNNLLDSNVTHSRMTNAQRIMNNQRLSQDNVVEEQIVKECPTCCVWKRWAFEQQLKLLKIQEALMSKQNVLQETMLQLKGKLQEQDKTIQMYNEELAKYKGQIVIMNSQLEKYQSQAKQIIQNPASAYHTPYKNNSHRVGNSVKISQLTDDKKGSTAATKPQLEWSAFQTNLDKFKPKKDNEIIKYQFENRMLKEYNSVLLERIKQSKYRKPF